MSSEFDFGDSIPRDDLPLCHLADNSLSLPMITRTGDVIDRSVTISSYQQICDSMFIMTQHGYLEN
jgi:hypothetical protein